MDTSKHLIRPDEDLTIWSVREISPGLVACGYHGTQRVDLYEEGTLVRSIDSARISSFGFVLAPDWDPTWSTEISKTPPKFIGLDNSRYVCIDASKSNGEETTEILKICTGIGGYMPRYIARRMVEDGKFAMIVLTMDNMHRFDLVQLFFKADCTPIPISEVEGKEIQGSRTIVLKNRSLHSAGKVD